MEISLLKKESGAIDESEKITSSLRMSIMDEALRRKYLSRLTEMEVSHIEHLLDPESDFISNIRLYRITEMVYRKGESAIDKFTTVFNTLSTYNTSVFILIDSDGQNTNFYLGVRNNESDDSPNKRSTVTIGDTLKHTLIGHFPGAKLVNEDRKQIRKLSDKILKIKNVASVSVVGDNRLEKTQSNEQFVQGLEKLCLSMYGKAYVGLIIADSQSSQLIQTMREHYQAAYTRLSPYQKIQFTEGDSISVSKSKSFTEMDGKQKAATIGSAAIGIAGVALGALYAKDASTGIMLGGQIGSQLSGLISSLAPTEQISDSKSKSTTQTVENKEVTDALTLLDELLKKTVEYDSYGLWNVAGYFMSDDMSAAEIAASNYRSLMNGDKSGREVSAINSWRRNISQENNRFDDLTKYLSRFAHPQFVYGGNIHVNATTFVSGKELGLHLGLPRNTVPGLPVIEHAEFGKEVTSYQLIPTQYSNRPEDCITIGKIFDMGQITNKIVELNNRTLNMHTFITGSTGSGKSNAVYQILSELRQDEIPFLVIEPAKGEYKDVFGNLDDVSVYSTNPKMADLIHINPFMFPETIHVLEHIDGLVEIFGVCWPMYDAMPAFFKDAILKSYEAVGWDLVSSTFEGEEMEYPDFDVLLEQLDALISKSDYASDIKSNYRGALLTRVKSLTVGLNKCIFTNEQTPYEKMFDENCIIDISRVKSSETKSLIMGLLVYILNEYRIDQKKENNKGLCHITVLEEAHNLLKNTQGGSDSEIIKKSVEMLTNTIAEIRTYGEGFIIVDQSPSSVDIAAIKNTNTKIVLRTPEAHDREAVGRSVGLNDDQVNEIAKLPSGVAVVYQNNWVSPVLTMINKANVKEETYRYECANPILSVRTARTYLLRMLLQPWLDGKRIQKRLLLNALNSIDLIKVYKKRLIDIIDDYDLFNGQLLWEDQDISQLQNLVQVILGITDQEIESINDTSELEELISLRTNKLKQKDIQIICYVFTYVGGEENDEI